MWSRSAIGRRSIHSRSGAGSNTGRSRRRSSVLDRSPYRHTNRRGWDFAPALIRSARVTGSRAGSRNRASDAALAVFRAPAQPTLLWLTAAKLQPRSDRRDFAILRTFFTFNPRLPYTEFSDRGRLRPSEIRSSNLGMSLSVNGECDGCFVGHCRLCRPCDRAGDGLR